ncbi:MAG: phenylalanine--tRNA ligase subunit alpha [Candidatus Limnocylindrus sp.]
MELAALEKKLRSLQAESNATIGAATSSAELDELGSSLLGKKGALTDLLRGIGSLSANDRPKIGAIANEVRAAIEAALEARRSAAVAAELSTRIAAERLDGTTPGPLPAFGSLHPIPETISAIAQIMGSFGFTVTEGQEIEDDVTNFQLLNIPEDHPSRDLWDTLYLQEPGRLLRTHTSPGQIRTMRAVQPPIRVILPGRCFRYEAVDASHGFEFHQVEGLLVDRGATLADLKGILDELARGLFGPHTRTRFRPGYYPFTEPSVAVDVSWGGSKDGWMTILGAGMVHPIVLENGGIDPETHQGFAFGLGVERIAMLRHGIPDLRALLENDLRMLRGF